MITRCPHCRQKVSVQDEGVYRCPLCGNTFRFSPQAPAIDETSEPVRQSLDETPICERCGQRTSTAVCSTCGYFVCDQCASPDANGNMVCHAHVQETKPFDMLKGLLRKPRETFAAVSPQSHYLNWAIGFGVVFGVLQVIFLSLYNLAFAAPMADMMQQLSGGLFSDLNIDLTYTGTDVIAAILFSPFSVVISLFFQVLILHGCHRLVGSGKSGLVATIKLVFYSQAAAVFSVVPLVGALAVMVMQFVLLIVGGSVLHRTTVGRAAVATLLPAAMVLIVAMVIAVIALVVFGGSGGGTLI